MSMKHLLATLGLCATLTSVADAQSPQYAAWGSITSLEAGWTNDILTIRHSAPLVNPGNCRITNAGYATNPADAGHNLFHTIALAAFLNKKEVTVLVHECFADKPRVIGISVR
jgi:hypothetical protein